MSLFFDVDWFDARLRALGQDRAALAAAAGLDQAGLERVYANDRAPTGPELAAFAAFLEVDLIETTLRAGVSTRTLNAGDAVARIESIEARLDAIDDWIEAFERERKRA